MGTSTVVRMSRCQVVVSGRRSLLRLRRQWSSQRSSTTTVTGPSRRMTAATRSITRLRRRWRLRMRRLLLLLQGIRRSRMEHGYGTDGFQKRMNVLGNQRMRMMRIQSINEGKEMNASVIVVPNNLYEMTSTVGFSKVHLRQTEVQDEIVFACVVLLIEVHSCESIHLQSSALHPGSLFSFASCLASVLSTGIGNYARGTMYQIHGRGKRAVCI